MIDGLKSIYLDICRGFSTASVGDNTVYFKHLDVTDSIQIERASESYRQKAITAGVPTEKEKVAWLQTKGLWTVQQQQELTMLADYIAQLEKNKGNSFLKSQLDRQKQLILEQKELYEKKLTERALLVGETCERIVNKKINLDYLCLFTFRDEHCKEAVFTKSAANEMEDGELYPYLAKYIETVAEFSEMTLKKIAVSGFFTSFFYHASGKPEAFFGLPVWKLTYNQSNLLSYGSFFRSIFENVKIPDNIRDDPVKIEEYASLKDRADSMIKGNGKDGYTGIVGATNEDIEILNGNKNVKVDIVDQIGRNKKSWENVTR